jgi:hypothetical protein
MTDIKFPEKRNRIAADYSSKKGTPKSERSDIFLFFTKLRKRPTTKNLKVKV